MAGRVAARKTGAAATSSYYYVLNKALKGAVTHGRIHHQDLPFVDTLRSEALLKARMHIGHHRRTLHKGVSGAIYGFRHNIAIFDITKTWKSLRTIFYGFAEMAQHRSSFYLLAPNPRLPLGPLIEKMRSEYPFKHNTFSSLYMTGYSDQRWIKGIFSNWKVTFAFQEAVKRRLAACPEGKKHKRYARYFKGIEGTDLLAKVVPDFVLVFAADRSAFHECRNLDLPMVGVVDSNTDPGAFIYPVFANDDSIESIQFMMDLIKRGIEEGRKREHEAFSMMLLQKVKAGLKPASAAVERSEPQTLLHDAFEEFAGISQKEDELEPWERQMAASLLENQRSFPDGERRRRERQELPQAVFDAPSPSMLPGLRSPIVRRPAKT